MSARRGSAAVGADGCAPQLLRNLDSAPFKTVEIVYIFLLDRCLDVARDAVCCRLVRNLLPHRGEFLKHGRQTSVFSRVEG